MKTNQLLALIGVVFLTGTANAFLNPCDLQNVAIDAGSKLSQSMIDSYREKLKQECVVYQKGVELHSAAQQLGINLEKIYLYQGLRYVDRGAYNGGKKSNLPIEFIFQVNRADANKPLAQRSDLVWRNWAKGILQVDTAKKDITLGKTIDLNYFQQVHLGFFAEDESGEMGRVLRAGELKKGIYPTVEWAITNKRDLDSNTAVAQIVDNTLRSMGLRPQLAAEEDYINKIMDVRDGKLFPAAPKAVLAHVTNMLRFLNEMLAQGRQNKPMIWNDQLFTPMDLAYFIQRYIVQIHGFHDGNGRISRFWQDVILAVFEMPVGASGDLSNNDMTADMPEYYHRSMVKGFNQLLDVEKCFNEVYPKVLQSGSLQDGGLNEMINSKLPYDCRFLK